MQLYENVNIYSKVNLALLQKALYTFKLFAVSSKELYCLYSTQFGRH